MANASEHRRKALKTVKTLSAILAVEAAVAIPFITWATLKVQEPHPDIVWLPRLTETLNAMGFQHIPMQVIVPQPATHTALRESHDGRSTTPRHLHVPVRTSRRAHHR